MDRARARRGDRSAVTERENDRRESFGDLDPKEVGDLVQKVAPLFADRPAPIQGAALADLLAIWLAGHVVPGQATATENLRADLLVMHLETVAKLVHVNARRMGT